MYKMIFVMIALTGCFAKCEDLTMPSSSRLVQGVDGIINKNRSPTLAPTEGQWIIEYSWSNKDNSGKPRYIISIEGNRGDVSVRSYFPKDKNLAREAMDATLNKRKANLKSKLVTIKDADFLARLFDSLVSHHVFSFEKVDADMAFESPSVTIIARYGTTRWTFKGSVLNLSDEIRTTLGSHILMGAIAAD